MTPEFVGILGHVFGFGVCVVVVSQLERRTVKIAQENAEKAPAPGSEPVRTGHEAQEENATLGR